MPPGHPVPRSPSQQVSRRAPSTKTLGSIPRLNVPHPIRESDHLTRRSTVSLGSSENQMPVCIFRESRQGLLQRLDLFLGSEWSLTCYSATSAVYNRSPLSWVMFAKTTMVSSEPVQQFETALWDSDRWRTSPHMKQARCRAGHLVMHGMLLAFALDCSLAI